MSGGAFVYPQNKAFKALLHLSIEDVDGSEPFGPCFIHLYIFFTFYRCWGVMGLLSQVLPYSKQIINPLQGHKETDQTSLQLILNHQPYSQSPHGKMMTSLQTSGHI